MPGKEKARQHMIVPSFKHHRSTVLGCKATLGHGEIAISTVDTHTHAYLLPQRGVHVLSTRRTLQTGASHRVTGCLLLRNMSPPHAQRSRLLPGKGMPVDIYRHQNCHRTVVSINMTSLHVASKTRIHKRPDYYSLP